MDLVRRTRIASRDLGTPLWAVTAVNTPDGDRLLAGGRDGRVWLLDRDLATETEQPPVTTWVTAISPWNDRVAIGDDSGDIHLWDPATQSYTEVLRLEDVGVRALAVVPRSDGLGDLLLSAYSDDTVWLTHPMLGHVRVADRDARVAVTVRGEQAGDGCYVADGQDLVALDDDGGRRLVLTGHTRDIRAAVSLANMAGPLVVATGAEDGTVRCWASNVATVVDHSDDARPGGGADDSAGALPGAATLLAIGPPGTSVVAVVESGQLRVLGPDLLPAAAWSTLPTHGRSIRSLAVLGDDLVVFTDSAGVWGLRGSDTNARPWGATGSPSLLSVAPDHRRIALVDGSADLSLIDGSANPPLLEPESGTGPPQPPEGEPPTAVTALACLPSGWAHDAVGLDGDGRLLGWPSATRRPVVLAEGLGADPDLLEIVVAPEADRGQIVIAGGTALRRLELLRSGGVAEPVPVHQHAASIRALTSWSTGPAVLLASGDRDGTVRISDEQGALVAQISTGLPVLSLAWTGAHLAIGTGEGTVLLDLPVLRDTRPGTPVRDAPDGPPPAAR